MCDESNKHEESNETNKPNEQNKPHIKLVRSYWEIHRSRTRPELIDLAFKFNRLKNKGPWVPKEYQGEYYGDAKKPI